MMNSKHVFFFFWGGGGIAFGRKDICSNWNGIGPSHFTLEYLLMSICLLNHKHTALIP